MEDILKRLLAVEIEAEQLVAQANTDREKILQQALHDAHQAQQQFQAKVPEIQAMWLKQAQEQAQQTIDELNKRYEEKKLRLRTLAEENQQKALEAAVHFITQLGK